MRRRRQALFVCAGFAAALITATFETAGCGAKSSASAGGTISTSAFFPAGAAVSGWARGEEIQDFSATDQSNYIWMGTPRSIIKVGVQSTATADHRFQTNWTLSPYLSLAMPPPEGDLRLWNLLATPRRPMWDEAVPPVRTKPRLSEGSIPGEGIVAYEASPQMQQAILDLGKAIEAKLEQ